MSLAELGVSPGEVLTLQLLVSRGHGEHAAAVERLPARGPLTVQVPAPDFDAHHWRA